MSGNRKSKNLIATILCMAMTGCILAYLPKEVSAKTSAEVVNGNFEVGYAGMDVYGWHLTAMADELSEGVQTNANATVQSLEAYTLKTEVLEEGTGRSKVAALTKYGKGTVAMTSQVFGITGGERYNVSCDVALKDWTPTAPGIQVAVKQMTDDGTLVKWTIPTTDVTDAGDMTTDNAAATYPTDEWTTITRTFDVDENTTKAELYIWIGAEDDMTGTVLFDKVAVSASAIENETTPENPVTSMLEGGDANYDSESNTSGSIDICDVIHMKKYLADEETVVSDSADMNKNDLVNEDDLTLLRWKLLGATTTAAADQVGIRTDLSNKLYDEAQDLMNSIYELPAVLRLEGFSGGSIEEAKLELTALNNQVKAKVNNRKTLAALESTYEEKYKMLYDMSDTSAFSKHGSYPYDGIITLNATPGTDEIYGNVLTGNSTIVTGSDCHLVIQYAQPADLATQVSGYEKVCFYVYNGYPSSRQLMCDFGGSGNTSYMTLNAGDWTKVELSAEDFISGSYFGIYSVGWETGTHEFKFSAIWAEKDSSAAEAPAVIAMIDALPETDEFEGYHEAQIKEARVAYDALSNWAKTKVSNYAKLTALENAYEVNYKMLYSMSDISAFTINDDYHGYEYSVLNPGTDATYGKVLDAIYANENTGEYHLAIRYAKPANLAAQLSGYEKVCFYVYNGRPDNRGLLANFGGGLKTEYKILNAGTWTKVEVPVADFISGSYFGINSVGYKTGTQEFKFSAIWAESTTKAAQTVMDMINALPAIDDLDAFSGSAIAEARAAYDALSDEAEVKVSNYATLTAVESAYAANYKVLYNMSDVSSFSVNTGYLTSPDAVTLTSGTDAVYGNVLNATYKHSADADVHLYIKYEKPSDLATRLEGYDKVCFYVYNDYMYNRDFSFSTTGSVYATLPAKSWTKIEIPVDDFVDGTYFFIWSVGYGSGTAYNYKFSPIWAESYAKSAETVIDMIDALPQIDALDVFSGSAISEVRTAYDALSAGAKAKVSNYATLTAVESAYAANYKMLYNMSDTSAFSKHSGYQYSEIKINATPEIDENYGNVLTATSNNTSGGDRHLVISYAKPSNLAEQLNGYEKVYFYVYNGYSSQRNLMCDFGGSMKLSYATLNAKTWTKVEVPVADFISGSYFGVYSVGWETGTIEFKFSAIWAESYAKSAETVIDRIDALPSAGELEGYQGAEINAVRTAYDALSEGAKNTVSNYATLTALESAYATKYKMLYDMSDISSFTKNSDYGGYQNYTLTSGTDVTYGNVLKATYASESTGDIHLAIKYTKPSNLATQLSGKTKVCFYVYNGRTDNRGLLANFGGGLKTEYKILNAGTWTKVEVPVADFISGSYFGIYSVGYRTGTQEFKFSAIWAE